MKTVLVVEDERDIRDLLRRYLERAGFVVLSTGTGSEGLRLLTDAAPDLLLLDLGLPDIDGHELLGAAHPHTPVVVLTARADTEDRIRGLELGADDYVVKPFSPREVVLRVQAVLARGLKTDETSSVRSFGGGRLRIDESLRECTVQGRTVHLTMSEWGLLMALSIAPKRVFSRLELVNRIHGYEFQGYERSIDSHVKNLRHKLDDENNDVVQTVVGVGYRFGLAPDG